MKLLHHLASLGSTATACVATIGNFDGLHRGHQRVIRQVQDQATLLGLPATLISFEPLPPEYFRQPPPSRILPLRDKIWRLQHSGIEQLVCLRFGTALANMEPEAFVQRILLNGLKVRHLVVGDDFRFGKQRRGDYALLQHLGAAHGMQVVDTPTFLHESVRVSSTRVRQALEQAELEEAAALLGYRYQLSGRVRHGDKRGRTIGFPTLNLRIPANIALRKGVYAVQVHGLAKAPLPGIANLGQRPTVEGHESRLEVHLFDFSADVYRSHVRVEPRAFLRDEQRFPSFQALQQQIRQDVEQARVLL